MAFFYAVKIISGTGKPSQERRINFYTFPSQALSCSGSTGLISASAIAAFGTPGQKPFDFYTAKITVKNGINM